ncbi:hypothetical protein [Psittacicella melopsittaci]|nr:hypothetical protein [Psittacicella melopsittaci]
MEHLKSLYSEKLKTTEKKAATHLENLERLVRDGTVNDDVFKK